MCTVTVWCVVLYSYGIVCCTCISINSVVDRRECAIEECSMLYLTHSSTHLTAYIDACTVKHTIP